MRQRWEVEWRNGDIYLPPPHLGFKDSKIISYVLRTLSQTFHSQLKAVLFGRVGVGSAPE